MMHILYKYEFPSVRALQTVEIYIFSVAFSCSYYCAARDRTGQGLSEAPSCVFLCFATKQKGSYCGLLEFRRNMILVERDTVKLGEQRGIFEVQSLSMPGVCQAEHTVLIQRDLWYDSSLLPFLTTVKHCWCLLHFSFPS